MKLIDITAILRSALPAVAALLLLSAGAEAAVPRLINFQGKLADSGGKAVTVPVSMVFKIYTAASGGAAAWTETQTVTPDAYGVYSVMLGTAAPLDISFSIPYWLGVTVGGDAEMLPRYRMASSPYALNSSTAAWAEGADWPSITNKPSLTIQGNVFNGASQLVQLLGDGKLPALDGSNLTGLPTAFLADGAVTTAKLANGAVTDIKVSLSAAAISSGKFGDDRVDISTQALSGGIYNLAGRLVQLGSDGSLPALNGLNLTGLTKAQVGLGSADNTSDAAKPVSTAQQTALNLKASLAGAAFTGAISAPNLSGTNTGDETALSIKTALGAATALADGYLTSTDWAIFNAKLSPTGNGSALTGLTKAQVGLGNVTNTSDAAKPVSTAQQAALDLKADLTGAAFTGAISAPNLSGSNTGDETGATIKTKLGAATALADGYLTAVDWNTFNGKLSPSGSGAALTGLTKAQVGLSNVNNTSDAAKPVSTAQQTALDLKADLAGAAFTGAVSAPNLSGTNTGDETGATIKTKLGAATALADGYLTSVDWAAFNGKLSPTGNGSALTGLTKAQVGLGNVTNTSDAAKPVSTAQQAALDLKADLAGAVFTGVISAANLSGTNTGDETSATIKTKLGAATALADGYLTSVDWAVFNGKLSPSGSGAALTGLTAAQVGLGSVDNTSDAAKPVSTAQQTALDLKANLSGAVFTGAVSATNLSGTNTGDQTNITGNAATVTNGVYTNQFYANPSWLTSLSTSKIDLSTVTAALTPMQVALSTAVYTSGDQTIGGVKTFSSAIAGDITGNAATATTAVKAGNIAGGSAGQLLYQTAADTTGMLAAGLPGQVLQMGGAGAPAWGTLAAGDVYKASTQTFTGENTFRALTYFSSSVYVTGGGIYSTGTAGGAALSGAGTRFMWIPNKAALRAGGVDGTQWNASSIGEYSAAFGFNNTASGLKSVVAGGEYNTAGGEKAAIGGGLFNAAAAIYGTVAGGAQNTAGNTAAVGGGQNNAASGQYASVAGGLNNVASGRAAAASGEDNTAGDTYAAVGGGKLNRAGAYAAAVSGGQSNTAGGQYSFVGGGDNNKASGAYSTVPGGRDNTALGSNSFAAGTGSSSTASGAFTWADSDGTVITENNVADRTWFKNKGGFLVTATTNSADGGLYLNEDNYVGVGTMVPTSTLSVTGKLTLKDGTEGLNRVLTSDANGLASWQPPAGGDVYKASTQTFTGLNTFTSTVTAKGFANMAQSIVLGSVTTFAADGSGVVLMTFNGTGNIATITGCSSGAVGQGQLVTFVVSAWMVGGIAFADTIPAAAAPDTMLLNGAAGTWTPPASAAALGAAITLLCTTVNTATPPAETFVKLWVEVGRSLSGV